MNTVGIFLPPPSNAVEMFEKAKEAEGFKEEISILISRSEKKEKKYLKSLSLLLHPLYLPKILNLQKILN